MSTAKRLIESTFAQDKHAAARMKFARHESQGLHPRDLALRALESVKSANLKRWNDEVSTLISTAASADDDEAIQHSAARLFKMVDDAHHIREDERLSDLVYQFIYDELHDHIRNKFRKTAD